MLKVSEVQEYLGSVFGDGAEVVSIDGLTDLAGAELKGFGYGNPILIEFKVNGKLEKVVLHTMKGDRFGHEHFSDRAGSLLLAHANSSSLPRHVPSVDVGVLSNGGSLKSVGEASEFFVVDRFVEGSEYNTDLERIQKSGALTEEDRRRALTLSGYLGEIHSEKKDDESLYSRRIRDLVGHGECIMGLIDSYPFDNDKYRREFFENIEIGCVKWRWKLSDRKRRLSQVHGDFHPWNVLFREGQDFSVLDRSRGEWGEPADDLTAMAINYMFYAVINEGRVTGPFKELFDLFTANYTEKTGDSEVFEVAPPFFLWRALVLASPIWYPSLSEDVRNKLFNFMESMLSIERFEAARINEYLGA